MARGPRSGLPGRTAVTTLGCRQPPRDAPADLRRGPIVRRLILQTTIWLIVLAAILFGSAGDWGWLAGWAFLAEIAITSVLVSGWLLRHDPALLEARLSPPFHRDQKPWDRVLIGIGLLVFLLWTVLMALDAGRFGWSWPMPVAARALGALLLALCMVLVWQTFRYNSFAAPQVRVQTERGQVVATGGPYRFVRHPMYAGSVLYFLGAPLLLGSWWGLLCAPLLIAGIGARAVGEERLLRRELAGYEDYAHRVRFRLIPGIW